MRNYAVFLIFICLISCKRDQPLPPVKPAYKYPELKGMWNIQNIYPFWNLKHSQTTTCVDMGYYYFIDSISPTQYIIYQGDFWGQTYSPSIKANMQLDTLTDSLIVDYRNNYNQFKNFFRLNLKFDHTTKNIIGEIGLPSPVNCTTLPQDSFQGNTLWWKYK